jgi:hypothetical protein
VKNNNKTPPAINFPLKLVDPIFIATNSFPNILRINSKELSLILADTIFLFSDAS